MADGNTDSKTDAKPTEDKPANDQGGANDQKPEPQTVTKEQFDHVLGDMHRFKSDLKERDAKIKTMEEDKLTSNQQWEKLAKTRETERDEAVASKQKTENAYLQDKKITAVKDAAVKLGLIPAAMTDLNILDLKGVEIQTTSDGQMNVLGADVFAKNLKASKPHWYNKPTAPDLATGHVGITTDGEVTVPMITKAEREANKTGDRTAYEALVTKYQAQKRAG